MVVIVQKMCLARNGQGMFFVALAEVPTDEGRRNKKPPAMPV